VSPRNRVYLVVALAAAAAVAVAVAVAVVPGDEDGDGAVARLEQAVAADPGDAEARVRLGVALYEAGDHDAAAEQWAEAERRAPDTPAALRAESLRHPEMAPNRPFFYPREAPAAPGGRTVAEQLADLRRRAQSGGAGDWLAYGVVLQRVGRPVSAANAFERALVLAPNDLDVRVAADVGRFDKDDPAAAFSRLGPLARDHPNAGVVRFHLGLLLLWIRQVDEARLQLERAVAAEPRSVYGREARDLLARLDKS
jgi:tetratricopeptide (TPR) repeat protein